MRPKVLVRAITVAVGTLLLTPAGVLAAKLTCLTGTDPSVANDLPQITAMRSLIEIACVCLSFDGTSGKTHAKYVTCAGNVIKARSTAGQLRSQCKAPVKRYYATSTCGVPAAKGEVPCIKKTAAGKVTCAIKAATKCVDSRKYTQAACATVTTCIDAADINHDGLIAAPGDSGACAIGGGSTPTTTTIPTSTRTFPPGVPTFTFTPVPPTSTSTRAPTNTPARTNTATQTSTVTFTNTPTALACVVGTGTGASCTESALNACLPGGANFDGTVTFNCGGAATIIVTSTKFIFADTTIGGGSLITISGGHSLGVFSVDTGVKFTVQNLTIANGNSADGGGGIDSYGTLTVTNSTFSGNSARGNGGGIFSYDTLTVTNSTFSGNKASYNDGGGGGGIFSYGTLTVTNSTFSGNISGNSATGSGGGIWSEGDPNGGIFSYEFVKKSPEAQ